MKTLILLSFLICSFSCLARSWSFGGQDTFVELDIDNEINHSFEIGESVEIHGHFCVKKERPTKCYLLTPEDLSKYDVKFFYPNIASEVTSNVAVTLKSDRHEFTFQTPAFANNETPQFVVQIFNKGSKIDFHQKSLVKIQALIEKLKSRLSNCPSKSRKHIEKLLAVLKKIEARWLNHIQNQSSIISKRVFPLQIKNAVSRASSWTNGIQEWQVNFDVTLGNQFEGEKTWLDVSMKPYPSNDDNWKIEYFLDDQRLKSNQLASSPEVLINEKFLSDGLTAGIHEFRLKISRRKKIFWNIETWDEVFDRKYEFVTFEDKQSPIWEGSSDLLIAKDAQCDLVKIATDSLGRLNLNSLNAKIISPSGEDASISPEISLDENILVPEIHGDQDGASRIRLKTSLNNLAEGMYELRYEIADFAGNQKDLFQNILLDRTPPVIQSSMMPVLTNISSQQMGVTVIDNNSVTTTIWLNGSSIYSTDSKSFDFNVDLQEGINLIQVISEDIAGHQSTYTYSPILLDTVAPQIVGLNVKNGDIIKTLNFVVNGSSNEALKSFSLNGMSGTLGANKTTFQGAFNHQIEGNQELDLVLVDLAGNTNTTKIEYQFILRILDKNLISVVPSETSSGLKIIGLPGAARSGLEIEASAGLFNSGDTIANPDGSFEIELDYFTIAQIEAYDYELNRTETFSINFNVDTTFAGIVKDVYDNPLPGVKVTIVGTNQISTTDAKGVFAIPNPVLGDQEIIIDGTTIPTSVTNNEKAFGSLKINVSLGNREQNVLERPIYLAPKYLDGTQTQILSNASAIVESPHAPGLSIDIPAGVVTFPGGLKTGSINALEIPASRTSIEILEEAEPETVYALEPSGVTFSERVHLTLPNVNEFPVGTELVILSKNSETGLWEVDGSANVTSPDKIETKPGEGISHFSEIYAAPLGMEIKSLGDTDKPSIDFLSGNVSNKIELPSFKSLGQNITPTLVYNSQWAFPTAIITNVFDLPRKYVKMSASVGGGNIFGSVKVKGTIESWISPEYIDSQFSTGKYASEKVRFKGMPDKSVVSYQSDLSELPTGIYPSESSYEIRYKKLTLRTLKITKKRLFKRRKTITKRWREQSLLDLIYPPNLMANIYHQNKKNSEFGVGWKIGLAKKILNPKQDRIMIEKESGDLAIYTLKNDIQTLVYDPEGISTFNLNADNVLYSNSNFIKMFKLEEKINSTQRSIDKYTTYISFNRGYVHSSQSAGGADVSLPTPISWRCITGKYKVEVNRDIKGILTTNLGSLVLDRNGRISNLIGETEQVLVGKNRTHNTQIDASFINFGGLVLAPAEFCSQQTGVTCTHLVDYKEYITKRTSNQNLYPNNYDEVCDLAVEPPKKECFSGSCTYRTLYSSSNAPLQGYSNGSGGSLGSAQLNSPSSMVAYGNYLLIADTGNNSIRRFDFSNNSVTTIAGNRSTLDNGDGLPALQASMYHPRGIASSSDGTLYVSTERGYIRKIGTDGKIQTIAGKPTSKGGILSDITDMRDADMDSPAGLALDENNNYLYVADTGHHRILRLDLSTYEARVVAGNNTCIPGDTVDGKTALNVSICRPEQIQLDSDGNLLVLDGTNKRIRKVNFGNVSSSSSQIFQASVEDNSVLFRNSDGSFQLTQRDGKETLFDASGMEILTKDSVGRISSYEYDASKRLVKANLPTGQSIRMTYSGDFLESITDPANRVTTFNYSNGKLSEVVYPDSSTRQFNYNDRGILIEDFNQKGIKTTFKLDKWNRLQEVEIPGGSKVKIQNSISQSIANDSTTDDPSTLRSFGNSPDNFQDIIEDAAELKTTYIKNENGYIDEIISDDGKVTKIERDGKGRTTKVTYADLSYISLTYDDLTGDLLSRYNSKLNSSETFTYNSLGQVTSFKDFDGKVTSAQFSPNGLVAKEILPDNSFATKTYNSLGLISTLTDHANRITTFDYDVNGNIVGITSPGGDKVSYVRDMAGNIISKTSPNNETTSYSLDSMNRIVSVKSPRNHITSYTYSVAGELLNVTDANSNMTSFTYDDFGNMVKKVSPMGETYEYIYDNLGYLTQEKDPSNNTKIYQYDEKKRLSRIQLSDDVINYSYDDDGNIVSLSNNTSQVDMSYVEHRKGTLLNSITTSGVYENAYSMTNVYDDNGNRVRLESSLGNHNFSYDAQDRLRQINGANASVDFNYDNLNRLTNVTRGNVTSTYTWNNDDVLKSLVHTKDSAVIQKFIYQHDKNSNKTDITTNQGSSTFQYDSEGQLVAADQPEINESFAYDEIYNRSQDQNGSFTYNSKKIRLEEDYRFIYAYDSRGNLVSKQDKDFSGKVWTYAYNSSNQLINVKLYESSTLLKDVTFKYDVLGRRVKKEIEDFVNSANSKIEKYAYDGEDVIAILDEDEEVLARFTHSGLFSDDVLTVDITANGVMKGLAQQAGTYSYIKDAQGTVTDIVNSSGNVVQRYSYSSYGKLLKITDGGGAELTEPLVNTNFTFTGRELDKEIDLYYYRARYYDPHSGRFLQKDPVAGFATSPATLNSYIYSLNNPGNRVDPSGKLSLSGLAQTAIYGAIFGAIGNIYDVNTSDNYTAREVALINTAIIMAAASFTGGAAASAAGASSGAAGATVGALAGGGVGGIGFESLGLGNFQQGFVAGAISGASSGAKVGIKNAQVSQQVAKLSTLEMCIIGGVGLIALFYGKELLEIFTKGSGNMIQDKKFMEVPEWLVKPFNKKTLYTPSDQGPQSVESEGEMCLA